MVLPTDMGRRIVETAPSGDGGGRSRRQILRESLAVAGALGLGLSAVGTASANGKGGEAAVPGEDYRPEADVFYFDEPTGTRELLRCDKGGNGVILAGWTFHYEGEDEARSIYTRDNAIDTSIAYEFAGNGQVDCGQFYLTPFARARGR